MTNIIGIRHEDKNQWERRSPLIPSHVGELIRADAVDNLPAELSLESSVFFSQALKPFIPALAGADFRTNFENCSLPEPIKRAVVLYRGELTPAFRFLGKYLTVS